MAARSLKQVSSTPSRCRRLKSVAHRLQALDVGGPEGGVHEHMRDLHALAAKGVDAVQDVAEAQSGASTEDFGIDTSGHGLRIPWVASPTGIPK